MNPSWDNLSRLAYYNAKTGSPEEADELYAMAGDTVSVKEMRTYAWIELQRGLLDLEFYRYNEALAHYQRADRAFSGYWLIEEHIAEVLALLGHTEEAEKLYRSVVEKAANPELLAALAEIVAEEAPAEAAALFARADALFSEQYGNYPAAAAGHFIEHLLQRPQVDENLLAYAERNYQARPNAESQFLLARVYRKFQDEASARAALHAVLETPWRTPEIEQMAQELGLLPTAG